MPRGDNPNSRKNLTTDKEILRQRAKNGTKKSHENAKAFKNVKEVILRLGNEEFANSKGQKAQGFEILGRKLFQMAQQGNLRAIEMCLKLTGDLNNNVDVTTNGKDVVQEPMTVTIIGGSEPIKRAKQ